MPQALRNAAAVGSRPCPPTDVRFPQRWPTTPITHLDTRRYPHAPHIARLLVPSSPHRATSELLIRRSQVRVLSVAPCLSGRAARHGASLPS